MGASEWRARVAYQKDIGAALQQARQLAYDGGDYYREAPNDRARSMTEEEYVTAGMAQAFGVLADDEALASNQEMFRDEWRAAQIAVTGPDSLLASQPESGTHSVIDMTHVAEAPGYGAVAPVPPDTMDAIFGTDRPTVSAVAEAIDQGRIHGFRSWQAMYLVGYRDGEPDQIFFVGYSGD